VKNKNVLVIGDSILDETNICSVIGMSLESPTMKTKLQSSVMSFGGASNVVGNLLQLGATVNYVTTVGNDKYNKIYKDWNNKNLNLFSIPVDRENTVKSRYWIDRKVMYKYLQVNSGVKAPHSKKTMKQISKVCTNIEGVDCILLVDYGLGIFSGQSSAATLLGSLRRLGKPIIFSSQISDDENNYPSFKGVDYMCMNRDEAVVNLESFEPTEDKVHRLSTLLNTNVCVTLGSQGSIFKRGRQIIRDRAHPVDSLDPTGAGDAFLASFVMNYEGKNLSCCNEWAASATLGYGTNSRVSAKP
jgi:D-beta-D-heptose 7-phosphate kinase / D-beta-D-heptose 1-phosphate adenosyltransferase